MYSAPLQGRVNLSRNDKTTAFHLSATEWGHRAGTPSSGREVADRRVLGGLSRTSLTSRPRSLAGSAVSSKLHGGQDYGRLNETPPARRVRWPKAQLNPLSPRERVAGGRVRGSVSAVQPHSVKTSRSKRATTSSRGALVSSSRSAALLSLGSIVCCSSNTRATSSGCWPYGLLVLVASRSTINDGGALSKTTWSNCG
jgi:hypothetical protein